MSDETSQEELRQQFEDENGLICSTLWERLTDTPYQVQLEAGEPPKQMALGDIEGLQRYITNTFAGVSAIVGEDEMRGFDYEARYGMAHYLLERFMANLDAATLDPAHMAQLEQIDLASYIQTPNVRSMVQKMHDTARILFDPPIDTLTEDELIGAIYKRGVALLETYQGYAEQKAVDMEPPLSEEYYDTVRKMIHEVAEAAAGKHSDLEPNDIMRAMWHLVEASFDKQEKESAKTFYESYNIKSDFFQAKLDEARTLNPYAVDRNHIISAAKQHLDEENMELMQASYRLISEVPFRVQNQETDEIEDKALSAIGELSPTLNNFNMAMHHMLINDCASLGAMPKAKLVTHYTDEFLNDIQNAMSDKPIDARAIENMNSTRYKIRDLEAYKSIFSALFGEMEIHGDIEKDSKSQQLMLRCGEALAVIAKRAEESRALDSIKPQHLEFLNDILAQLGEALDTDDVFDDMELGPVMTAVWDLMEEAMYSEQDPAEFYETHNMRSEWMQEQLGAAIERSEQMQEEREAEDDEVEMPSTEPLPQNAIAARLSDLRGLRRKPKSIIPEEEQQKIDAKTTMFAELSEHEAFAASEKYKNRNLKPAILGFKQNCAAQYFNVVHHEMTYRSDPVKMLGKDFDRLFEQMQQVLEKKGAKLDEEPNNATKVANAYASIFLQNQFRRICYMHDGEDIGPAYQSAVSRALSGEPSDYQKVIETGYRLGALRHGYAAYVNQDEEGKITRFNVISNRPQGQREFEARHGPLSDVVSRFGRMGDAMRIIEENADLMFSLLSHAEDPKAEMEGKMPILRDLAERLDVPPEPYGAMPPGAAIEILSSALFDAMDPDISVEEMRNFYDFGNAAFFDAFTKSNPDLKTRMMQNAGRITPQKGAPYVQ